MLVASMVAQGLPSAFPKVFKGAPVGFEKGSRGFRAKALGIRLEIPRTPLNTFEKLLKPLEGFWHFKNPEDEFVIRAGCHYGLTHV